MLALLADLRSRGLTVSRAGDRIAVTPAEPLTDVDRVMIRAHRTALLAALLAEDAIRDPGATTCPPCPNCRGPVHLLTGATHLTGLGEG